MKAPLKIGTRKSELAVWQATRVQTFLHQQDISAELIFINSEGDVDLVTPLYEMGVQGIFTKTLDAALLNNRIDIAVHSMKDVPTQLPRGIKQAAVLERGSYKDLLVFNGKLAQLNEVLGLIDGKWPIADNFTPVNHHQTGTGSNFTIGTSSIRRRAQWLHRYPDHRMENLRGNMNTRLRKVLESDWNGAIFAAAGLERINLRPENSIELDWMLPAPAQGAIMVVCREDDDLTFNMCQAFNHRHTELCTKIERDFLRGLSGGCSTPISALAQIEDDTVLFKGSIYSPDGKEKVEIDKKELIKTSSESGSSAAAELLQQNAAAGIIQEILNAKK